MRFEISEKIELIQSELTDKNEILYEKILDPNNVDKFSLGSKETVSAIFCNNILEDLDFIIELNKLSYSIRYTISTFRSMHEHIILYKYIMENPEQLNIYLGDKITDEYLEKIDKEEIHSKDPFELLKGLSKKRKIPKNVREMCDEIEKKRANKDKPNEERIKLYDIYSVLSNKVHSAYFEDMLDTIEEIESEADPSPFSEDNDFLNLLMIESLLSFFETYNEIVI